MKTSGIFTPKEIDMIISGLSIETEEILMSREYYLKKDDNSALSDNELSIVAGLWEFEPRSFETFPRLTPSALGGQTETF